MDWLDHLSTEPYAFKKGSLRIAKFSDADPNSGGFYAELLAPTPCQTLLLY